MKIDKLVVRTPLVQLAETIGGSAANIFLKAENLQPFGSYKIRGIASLFNTMTADDLRHGVEAASAGNMGQALAYAARFCGIPCTIYVPDSAPDIKKNKIKSLGANLVELPFAKLWQLVTESRVHCDRALFVHPVFTESLFGGYEEIVYEVIADLPEVDAIVVPIGLGGLAMALSRAIRKSQKNIDLYVCESETAAPFKAALTNGGAVRIETTPSFIDAIGTPEILPDVYHALVGVVRDSEVVSVEDTRAALESTLLNNKLLCEGAAACSIAAAKNLAKKRNYHNIVAVLTGGNLPRDYLCSILSP